MSRSLVCTLALALPLLLTGCPGDDVHPKAVAAAIAPVVDEATATYSSVNTIHQMATDYDTVDRYKAALSQSKSTYDPSAVTPPLLPDKDIQPRLKALAALQAYAQLLVAITSGSETADQQAAAKSLGTGLSNVTNTLEPSIDALTGMAPPTTPETDITVTGGPNGTLDATATSTTTAAGLVSTTTQNVLSTSLDALEKFLTYKKTKKELPPLVDAMDGNIKQLCHLLASDIQHIRNIEDRDYDTVFDDQKEVLLLGKDKMDPGVQSLLILKLPELGRERAASDAQLNKLGKALLNLELTHAAYKDALHGNNPTTLQQKLAELTSEASDLGKFYSSL